MMLATSMKQVVPSMLADVTDATVLTQFVGRGGVITWCVLIPLSVATLALVLNYMITIRRGTLMPKRLADSLTEAVRRGQTQQAVQIAARDETMLGQAACAGLTQMSAGRASARVAIDEVVEARATRLFRRIEYLNVIGNISPMIGLLGTVLGMIRAFSQIYAAGGGMPEAGLLANHISMALVTTFWGILIAIPALTMFALFRNRIDAFAAESVRLSDSLVALSQRGQADTVRSV